MNSSENKVKKFGRIRIKQNTKNTIEVIMSAEIPHSTKKNTPSTSSLSSNSLGMASTSSASKEEDDNLTQND